MCRLYGFRSAIDSAVHHSLVAAENAMARQSTQHQDGWGIAFYVDRFPQVIRNDARALGDSLFREVSAVVTTRTFLAHIRQATAGSVRVLNCHPFQHGAWTFAHNGQICGFETPAVRERVDALIDPRFRKFVLGDTDSERFFYVVMSRLARQVTDVQHPGIAAHHVLVALREAVAALVEAAAPDSHDPNRPTKLNLLLTNGRVLVGYKRGVDLFFSTYKSRCPERDTCWAFHADRCETAVNDGIVQHLLVSSEVIAEGTNVWIPLEHDGYVALDHAMNFQQGRLGVPYQPTATPSSAC
jgi:predicted glutamine amidotransferase